MKKIKCNIINFDSFCNLFFMLPLKKLKNHVSPQKSTRHFRVKQKLKHESISNCKITFLPCYLFQHDNYTKILSGLCSCNIYFVCRLLNHVTMIAAFEELSCLSTVKLRQKSIQLYVDMTSLLQWFLFSF